MRLALPTLVLVLYVVGSMILWLPCRPWVKIIAAFFLFVVGLKYIIYERVGGSFIAPDFSPPLLLIMEFFYSALLILVFLLVVKDAMALVLLVSRWFGSSWFLPFTQTIRSAVLILAALGLAYYGTSQSLRVPGVRTVEIPLAGLPEELDGFSIAQLTDIHVGPLLKRGWLNEVVARTNGLEADLVVLTGDMIDGTPEKLREDIAPLKYLHGKQGVYGITGNHEYYFDVQAWLPVFKELGVDMLMNEYRSIPVEGENLILAGVPDQAALHFRQQGPDLSFLKQTSQDGLRVLLQHRPSSISHSDGVDLKLSGHTHGGHLFFLKWLIANFNGGLAGGLFDYDGSKLYLSPGTGVWSGFSCRIGVPSEISLLILRQYKDS